MFDADGGFCIYKCEAKGSSKYPYFTLSAVINIRERELCEIFQKIFGGSVQTNKRQRSENHSVTYTWRVTSNNIRSFIDIIKPHLILKTKQAEVVESFYKIRPRKTTRMISPWEFVQMEEHRLEMNRLNQNGVGKEPIEIFPEIYK